MLSALHLLGALLEFGLLKLRIMPAKHLQLGVVILRDESGQPLATPHDLLPHLQAAVDLFWQRARVRITPIAPQPYTANAHDCPACEPHWMRIDPQPAHPSMLDVHCNATAFREDLWGTGARYHWLSLRLFWQSGLRRLLGYGAPVIAIVVRSVDKHGGCSVGPLADYVTLAAGVPACLVHELGHACNLLHRPDEPENLMHPICGHTALTDWQVALIRASRHVTFF